MATHKPTLFESFLSARSWAHGKVEPYLTWLPDEAASYAADILAVLVIVSIGLGIWKKAAEIWHLIIWLPKILLRWGAGRKPPDSDVQRAADAAAERVQNNLQETLRTMLEDRARQAEASGRQIPEDAVDRAVAAAREVLSSNDPAKAEAQEALRIRDFAAAEDALERAFDREAFAAGKVDDEARQLKAKAARTAREKAALAATRSVEEAIVWYRKAAGMAPEHFWTQIELTRLCQANGNLGAASVAARAALDLAVGDRDRSVASDGIGDVLRAQGDLGKALESYQASMVIREQLAQADASNAGLQRDLSVSHERTGDLLEAQDEIFAAVEAYENSLVIAQKLVDRWPDHPQFKSDLEITRRRLEELRGKLK